MKTSRILGLSVLFLTLIAASSIPAVASQGLDEAAKAGLIQSYGRLPLSFQRNEGQADGRVQFLARRAGRTYWFTSNEVVLDFSVSERARDRTASLGPAAVPDKADDRRSRHLVRISFPGSNPNVRIEGLDQQPGRANYFIGSDKSKWRADVPIYRGAIYWNLYSGVDLKYEGRGGDLKYEFVVGPGADPGVIRLAYQGIQGLCISDAGELVASTMAGDLVEARPLIYQLEEGHRKEIRGAYRIVQDGMVGFSIGEYDSRLPLVIDPLLYSTYLGGGDIDEGYGIAADSSGNAYVTGYTSSVAFPTQSPFQGAGAGNYDVFVTKLNPSGSSLLYSTYLGGGDNDSGFGIAVDSQGNAYITGETYSDDFPTQSPFQGARAGTYDVFVTKLNPSGSALIYSTYLGGGDEDYGYGIALDSQGNAYITGATYSDDFPTWSPYQGAFAGGLDVFVTKLNPSGSDLLYSTYLGGVDEDYGYGIAVDSSGNAYVTGYTWGDDFPTQSPYQGARAGNWDVFVTKLNPSGSSLIYSTYLGGGDDDEGYGIAVDSSGNAYVTGYTWSVDFPTQSPYQGARAGWIDVFVTKLNPSGSSLLYSTYLGGGDDDEGYGIAVDSQGNAYVTGHTISDDFPTQSPFQGARAGGSDVFVTKLNPSGSSLIYSTYLGGVDGDYGCGIAVDSRGKAYVTGFTQSDDFPTWSPFQRAIAGDADVFIARIATAWEVSGYVRTPGGFAIPGVFMVGLPGTPTTDATGFYTGAVDYGWSGTVVPQKAGGTFSPAYRVYTNVTSDQVNQDYIGTIQTFIIFGHVRTSGGLGISGVLMNGLPGNPVTDASGFYYAEVDYNWSGTVAPNKPGFSFDPLSRSYTNVTSDQIDQNYTGTPTASTITLSGTARTAGGVGIPAVTMTGLPGPPATDVNGFYICLVGYGWSGAVAPQKADFTFSPISRSYSNLASDQIDQDYTGTPTASTITISGHVRTAGGLGIQEVSMIGLPGTPGTDADGFYTSLVEYGWSGTVVPQKAGLGFSPAWRIYMGVIEDQTGQDYTGVLAGYQPVYRFWSQVYAAHFYTIYEMERDFVNNVLSSYYTEEGVGFHAYSTPQPGALPVHRFWSPVYWSHFYTISEAEKDYIIATWPNEWMYEGVAFYAYPFQLPGTVPVHRFWSPVSGSHFMTISEEEMNYVTATWPGYWIYEGVAFYAYP